MLTLVIIYLVVLAAILIAAIRNNVLQITVLVVAVLWPVAVLLFGLILLCMWMMDIDLDDPEEDFL